MNNHHDDEVTARVFSALCDPLSLRLLLHVLDVGEYDVEAVRDLGATDAEAAARLERLVDIGLLARSPSLGPSDVYRVVDAAALESLLAAVRQLSARRRDL